MIFGLIGGKDIAKYTIADVVWLKIAEISSIDFEFKIITIETFADLCKFYWSYCEDQVFKGFNVALPWKTGIIGLVDFVDERDKEYNSVNVVYKKDKKVSSSNTDVIGIEKALLNTTNLENKKILVLGGGGAGLPTSIYLSKKYNCAVHIFDIRNIDNIPSPIIKLSSYSDIEHNVYDIIINATPVGKYYLNEVPTLFSLPLDLDLLQKITHNDSVVQEMNYFPLDTQLIKFAKSKCLKVVSGVDMLVYQAIESFGFYTDYEFRGEDSIKLIDFIKNYSINKENELLR